MQKNHIDKIRQDARNFSPMEERTREDVKTVREKA